jgi:asparagine synthase (glutamine-hydrolysing)
MCGIAGIFSRQGINQSDIRVVESMNEIQAHRGPDDEGIFFDSYCVLGHRRLAIIDLSRDGHQPFESDDHQYQIIHNGEIYNYIELREELENLGWQFKTKTDTEVLLKAYQQFGTECLSKFNGMFAFAIYDSLDNTIFIARDRVGIKPLYYTILDSKVYFTSEIKSLCSISDLALSVNYQSLFDFLVFNRTDIFDETFFKEIKRIPKGHYAVIDKGGMKLHQWWHPENYIGGREEKSLSLISEKIREIFVSALRLRMRSDVTVGCCLSGGLDSSMIVGALFEHCDIAADSFSTFTASFPGHAIDETCYIDSLNQRYRFKNIRTYPTAENALEKLREFVYTNDEPTTNSSFFAQYEVMKLAKEYNVTVLLDGQGGDENFAGYQYFHGFHLYGLLKERRILDFGEELLKNMLRRQDISAYQTLMFQLLPDSVKKILLLRTVPYIQKDFFYEYIGKSRIYNEFFDVRGLNDSLVRHFQYKLEHLLRMEDRISMAFSLEARVPYLDYRLIEYLLGVSGDLKIKLGETKYLQKEALGRYTVDAILSRKDKIGFGTPRDEWMLTDGWQRLTEQNYNYLNESFSGVFKKDTKLPKKGFDRWKINNLATWKNVFMDR